MGLIVFQHKWFYSSLGARCGPSISKIKPSTPQTQVLIRSTAHLRNVIEALSDGKSRSHQAEDWFLGYGIGSGCHRPRGISWCGYAGEDMEQTLGVHDVSAPASSCRRWPCRQQHQVRPKQSSESSRSSLWKQRPVKVHYWSPEWGAGTTRKQPHSSSLFWVYQQWNVLPVFLPSSMNVQDGCQLCRHFS